MKHIQEASISNMTLVIQKEVNNYAICLDVTLYDWRENPTRWHV